MAYLAFLESMCRFGFRAPEYSLPLPGRGADHRPVEVGARDHLRQVYGLDVSEEMTHHLTLPPNFTLILSDGTSVPLPPNSVDVACSNQLMEHLHPMTCWNSSKESASAPVRRSVHCVTPSRLNGPHDISQHFDPVATGFHLKEYAVGT